MGCFFFEDAATTEIYTLSLHDALPIYEVRKAVREELRKGAAQIKLMVSGGVLSPSDPLWMDQYSEAEIRAAVEEAATRRTYVMAHAHTASAGTQIAKRTQPGSTQVELSVPASTRIQ